MALLRAAGHEAYLVGGCVRDSLLGREPKDCDVSTNATPEEVRRICAASGVRIAPTGLGHGTLTLLLDEPVEVTTYRAAGGLIHDLGRRDFTLNALAWDLEENVIDPFSGIEDIRHKIIRAVHDPEARLREDPLRILRGLRFAASLGFTIEPRTREALFRNRALLTQPAAERIGSELTQLLCAPGAAQVLLAFVDILSVPLPELAPLKGFEQHSAHHVHDVLRHTAFVLQNVPPLPSLRWAALLHDAGKPETFTRDERGVGHFYGHAEVGARIARNVLKRLRIDTKTALRVEALIQHHSFSVESMNIEDRAIKRLLNRWTPEFFFALLELKRGDVKGQNPALLGRLSRLDACEARARAILNRSECLSLKDLALKGGDLIALGVPPGPEIGRILKELLEQVLDEHLPNERDALLEAAAASLGPGNSG
ncbi:MAG: HD domain-containing protein [Fretibacterium sp.]|nr:HD domain-containing protein [Fretibacterium sp.]